MSISADFAQTFYIDGEAVKGASYAFVNSVQLFFRNKPTRAGLSTASGILLPDPGVVVYLCETRIVNGVPTPDLSSYIKYGRARLSYNNILTSTNGMTATTFEFACPVPIETNKSYAIVIRCDGNDSQYSLWRNKAGETYNGIQNPTVTKGALDGQFFLITNGTVPTPLVDTDLKFVLKGQKFDVSQERTYSAVNRNFEFIVIDKSSSSGVFYGGEAVFGNTGYVSAQTVNISATSTRVTGTNTQFTNTFTVGDSIVFNSGNTNSIRKIAAITNNTVLTVSTPPAITNASSNYLVAPVATVYDFNYMKSFCILSGSTANATHNFLANATFDTIVGETTGAYAKVQSIADFPVNYFTPEFKVLTPTNTTSNVSVKLSNSSQVTTATPVTVKLFDQNIFRQFKAYCYSRTTEVTSNTASFTNGKSMNFDIALSSDNEFVSPLIDEEDLIFHTTSVYLNTTLTGEDRPNGQAASKIISKKINLANNQISEDIKVYLTAYRPPGTDVEVFVRFYNTEDSNTFENTSWTRLLKTSPSDLLSSIDNESDLVELEYSLGSYPLSLQDTTVSGTLLNTNFAAGLAENRLYGDTTEQIGSFITEGSLIRIYDPIFPENSIIARVLGVNDNVIQINITFDPLDSKFSGLIGSALKVEVAGVPTAAFKNYLEDGILSYYNTNGSLFTGYNSFAVKIVLMGDDTTPYFPKVDDIRAIACSV